MGLFGLVDSIYNKMFHCFGKKNRRGEKVCDLIICLCLKLTNSIDLILGWFGGFFPGKKITTKLEAGLCCFKTNT